MSLVIGRDRSTTRGAEVDAPVRRAPDERDTAAPGSALRRVLAARGAGACPPPDDALALQRWVGNRATARMLTRRASDLHTIASEGVRGSPSPFPYRDEIQRSFGSHSVAHVQAFMGSRAAAASRAIGATAYTRGSRVAFSDAPSLRTAAHEAAHTVQQQGAGVRLPDGVGQIGDRHERHADAVADRVVRGQSAESLLSSFAPSPGSGAPAIQGEWISRHKDQNELYRYWKKVGSDAIDLATGWYRRTDPAGTWEQANLEAGDPTVVALPAEQDILPGPVVSHTTRYDRSTLTADVPSAYAQSNITRAANEQSRLKPELEQKVLRQGGPLRAPKKLYRWGEYQYEKNYVANNGFRLGNVNFGSQIYGPGMYVADTPWGSAGYATEKDGSIIEVTVPAGSFYLDPYRGNAFTSGEEAQLWQNPRFPALLLVSRHSGWMTIKDDRLDLKIEFYRPEPDELARVAPHLQRISDVKGYTALQIIDRQLGSPIAMPSADQMAAMFINQPELKRQKIQAYVRSISRFEFVPFMLSEGALDFSDEVGAFFDTLPHAETPRYKRHFAQVEVPLRLWARQPFSLSQEDYKGLVLDPFKEALKQYGEERDEKKKQKWYKGHGLTFSSDDKASRLAQFSRRLDHFRAFLEVVDSQHGDLADDQKHSHSKIKVGRNQGIVAKNAAAQERKEVIAEAMMRGVAPVSRRTTPTAIVMLGLPGSGKSTVLKELVPDPENYVIADPDDAKTALPAFQSGLKAKTPNISELVHEESKQIANHVLEQARSTRRNLIYDTTGTGVSVELIPRLKQAGYTVKVVYVHVTKEKATARVKEREKQTGRGVPQSAIDTVDTMMRGARAALAEQADRFYIYNNMDAPQLVWSGKLTRASSAQVRQAIASLP